MLSEKEKEREELVKKIAAEARRKTREEQRRKKVACTIVNPGLHSREEINGIPFVSPNQYILGKRQIRKISTPCSLVIDCADYALDKLNNAELALQIAAEADILSVQEEGIEAILTVNSDVLYRHSRGEFPASQENPQQNAQMNLFYDDLDADKFFLKKAERINQ